MGIVDFNSVFGVIGVMRFWRSDPIPISTPNQFHKVPISPSTPYPLPPTFISDMPRKRKSAWAYPAPKPISQSSQCVPVPT